MGSQPPKLPGVRLEELIAITDELALLAQRNIALDMGLTWLSGEGSARLRRFSERLRDHLQRGDTLEDALRETADVPEPYCALIRIGEQTGSLPGVLGAILAAGRRIEMIRRVVLAAMVYPTIIVLLAWTVFTIYVAAVAEPMGETAASLDLAGSGLLLALASLRPWLPYLGPAVAVAIVGVVFVSRRAIRRVGFTGTPLASGMFTVIPVVRRLMRYSYAAAFVELLASLVQRGTPLETALPAVGAAIGHQRWRAAAEQAAKEIRAGGTPKLRLEGAGVTLRLEDGTKRLEDRLQQTAQGLSQRAELFGIIAQETVPVVLALGGFVAVALCLAAVWLPIVEIIRGMAQPVL